MPGVSTFLGPCSSKSAQTKFSSASLVWPDLVHHIFAQSAVGLVVGRGRGWVLPIKAEAVEGIKRRALLSEVGALGSAPPAPRRARDWSSPGRH